MVEIYGDDRYSDGILTGEGKITGGIGSKLKITGSVQNDVEIDVDGIYLDDNASFTTNADKIHRGQVDMFGGAVLNLTGGTIDFNITNEENTTAKIVENATVEMSSSGRVGNLQVAGTLDMNGQTNKVTNLDLTATGTLDLKNNACETVVFENLTAAEGATVNFDAKFTADGDKISAETGSGKLALGSIGVKDDFVGNAGDTTTITFLTNGAASITLTGSAETVFGAYKYIFEPGTTAGTLKVTKDIGYSLVDIINDRVDNHVAGQVSNYSLNDDKTMDADMGTLTRPDSKVARAFTINGNKNKLLGGNKAGITVKTGDILTYKDIAEVSGFNGAAVINNGTFNANNVTFKNEIAGSGTMNVDGTVNADAKVSNKMNVAGTGTLNIVADNLKNAVTNNGTVNLGAGTLATGSTVTGGTLNINDDVTANASDIAGETNTIAANKTLTLSGGNLAQNISGGKVVVQGNVTTTADYLNRQYEIAADKMLIVNAGTLQYNDLDITGTGKLAVDGKAVLQATTKIFEVKDAKQDSALSITADKIAFVGGILSITGVTSYSLDYYNSITALLKEQGNTSLQMSGAITVQEGENVINGILSGGVTVAEGASLRVSEINVTDDAQMSGKIATENLISTEDKIITVGNADDDFASHVSATTIQLNGGMIFLDPVWKDGIKGASHVATQTTDLDGAYVVGQNSVLTFGATNEDADAVFSNSGLKWGENDITAAAYVANNINLIDDEPKKGSLTVDGNLTTAPTAPAAGTVNLAPNSLLMVKGEKITYTAAVSGVKNATVDAAAHVFIQGAKPETTYLILAGEGITSAFTNGNVALPGTIKDATVELDESHEYLNITTGALKFSTQNTVIPNVGEALVQSGNEQFAQMIDTLPEQQTANVNAYANLGENLGVSRGAYDVAYMVGDAIDKHWDNNPSGSVEPPPLTGRHSGDVWVSGTRNKETLDGVELGGMKAQYDAQYNGAVVGVNWSGNFGMAINYTDGKVNNRLGGHNDAEYYGGSLYAKIDWGNLRITADATYTYGKNELSQNGITADAKTETISGGLTLKYMAKAGLNKIGSFAGIRYMHIKGRDYTDSLGVNLSGNFGMAINYTDGKVNNKLGGHNDAEYYGGSLYAKTDWGNLR
ncbi:MAG: autotransporter outer membrane beta-barrel domain-containing protein, partial [Phascolarctobacterium sp.]|nr:autotransporter outer membrane beta-barrel domain-containing protein [Candidatus Phascolarctobacterium equi]